MLKELRKYYHPEQMKKDIAFYDRKFSDEDYLVFLRKFRGSMIYRGKSSLSYKLFDRIRIILKRAITPKKEDPELGLKVSIENLIPVIGVSNIRRGRKVQTVPSLLKMNRRIVLINKWLLSSQKNKSNVRGIKVNEVARLILMALVRRGNAYGQKVDYVKRAFNLRYILLRPGKRVNKKAFIGLQKYVLRKLRDKYNATYKPRPITDADSVETFIKAFQFLRFKYKSRKMKRNIRDLRKILLNTWNDLSLDKVFTLKNWMEKTAKSSRLKIDPKQIDIIKKRYPYQWRKGKRRT